MHELRIFLSRSDFPFYRKIHSATCCKQNLRNPENMNWENKFSSILRETESNLSKARVCKTCCLDILDACCDLCRFSNNRPKSVNPNRLQYFHCLCWRPRPLNFFLIIFQRKLYTPGHGHLDLTSRGCKYPYCYQ